jgi:hypothetical protein
VNSPPPVTHPMPCVALGSPAGECGHAGSQPQLHMDDDADASVECHSSKPCTRGEETGHLLLAKSWRAMSGLGKKLPRCHLPMCSVE